MSTGVLIGLDWGTSSLRAMLFAPSGQVLETRREPWGIRNLPEGGFSAALAAVTSGWPDLPCIAAGMVGSRNGWHEVPYLELPAGAPALAAALDKGEGRPVLVPGLRDAHGPDVMRGEETQLIGLLASHPDLVDATIVLPGTHSKWATIRHRAIVSFRTLMTGELYALLRQHSILGAGIDAEAGTAPEAFVEGVRAARDSGEEGAMSRLFGTRARMLDGSLAAHAVPDYISGLLIGEEFRSMAHARHQPLWLVGDDALCTRYRLAAHEFDQALAPAVIDAAPAGLWLIAAAAGLVHPITLSGVQA
jgi:2-dehydro-3-deoxygalactonokinase